MYNILADLHHAGLLNSLILLFEKRLGGNLFRPIGREWYEQGFWNVYEHEETIEQYLGINGATPDDSPKLNEVLKSDSLGLYNCHDISSGTINKAITLERFYKSKIDIVIASIPQHVEPFRKLCDMHPDKPTLIYQIGNAWNITPEQESLIDGIMASARLRRKPSIPYIEYHQEFDLNIFNYEKDLKPGQYITSFVNCFNTDDLFKLDWTIFEQVERMMPDWDFKALGGGCRDGYAKGDPGVAQAMKNARFIWHTKNGGDGYGHIVHNTGAVGRPMITRKSYYYGKLGEDLMIDGETCIAIDGLGKQEIVNKILHFSEPDRYRKMCNAVANNFKKMVNFEEEEEKIRQFLLTIIQ